ncbi:MAG: sel1 repeat family protein [Alphaproteobacteria bacterium]|nr:sel1 repeat family protein [Alphaproteobacteria bacterium]
MKLKILLILLLITSNVLPASNTNNTNKESIDNYIFELLPHKSKIAKQYLQRNIHNAYCCYLLGTIYLSEKDFKNADIYLTKASKMGSPEAINSIGDGYYSGDIRKKNHKEALRCYVKAAKMGNGAAQFNAGAVYFKYSKSSKTLRKAIYWLDKASKNDDIKDLREYILICKKEAELKLKSLNTYNSNTVYRE